VYDSCDQIILTHVHKADGSVTVNGNSQTENII